MNYNATNCHNFKRAEELGRCPLVSICNNDCAYVWKFLYDNADLTRDYELELDELQDEVDELRRSSRALEDELDELESTNAEWEKDYNRVISDLARIMSEKGIKKLTTCAENKKVGSWVQDLIIEWGDRNAIGIK